MLVKGEQCSWFFAPPPAAARCLPLAGVMSTSCASLQPGDEGAPAAPAPGAAATGDGQSQHPAATPPSPGEMRVTLLATGSPVPSITRFGMSTLVHANGLNLAFDAGRGATTRLIQVGVSLGQIDGVFLTHSHSDHVNGLADMWLSGYIPALGGREGTYDLPGRGEEHRRRTQRHRRPCRGRGSQPPHHPSRLPRIRQGLCNLRPRRCRGDHVKVQHDTLNLAGCIISSMRCGRESTRPEGRSGSVRRARG